ncbi:hypothetical protein P22_1064 [Propionispora sp. 2/2-37]|uniref:PTS lactose/cellobiose transporter subunit IIA n=1 Tax=Propionispora sp. 2/2-37 TaxID=1677858 RepID=UPI0006C16738|nr:PTS lactose/cellobiose transporter subunit IIA [Propionispora sp. 2/2-37]CUH94995.1 hypothetical protein P22_1064 [Propionispora sp. 2/2-37]
MDEELQMITVEIVAYAGDARSKYMEALEAASRGEYGKVESLIQEGNDLITQAHNTQTAMLQKEAAGEKLDMSFLMVHAQDHLMTVMLLRDLVKSLVNLYKK